MVSLPFTGADTDETMLDDDAVDILIENTSPLHQ